MAQQYPLALRTTRDRALRYLSRLWKISRTDGITLRFTDHDVTIIFEGEAYSPAGSLSPTATQFQADLKENNKEYSGVILESEAITYEDLQAGRYQLAEITEYVVDWRNPYASALFSTVYTIAEVSWSRYGFTAQVEGVETRLRQVIGGNYTRNCRWLELGSAFGDSSRAGCKVNLSVFTESGSVDGDALAPRKRFNSTVTGFDVDYFKHGVLTFTSGPNTGLSFSVQHNTSGTFHLYTMSPFDISSGDTFDVSAGCDRTIATCNDKFNNVENFGGFVHIPGTDAIMRTPNAK